MVGDYLTPVVTFGAFLGVARHRGEPLSVATAFTSLSVIALLSAPLSSMFQALPQFSMTLACFGRIEQFLREDDRPDLETITLSSRIGANSESGIELQTFNPPKRDAEGTDNTIIKLNNASFGSKELGQPILQTLNLSIPRSTITIIIGKVGSGKSSLLKSLIGEIPLTSGTLHRQFSSSAYCDQQPWLINDTIQNNILGQAALEARWYDSVVKACALDRDFEELEAGELSLVGSKGISLSGGQKARVVSVHLFV
jgi:ATP-binding cassette, subfamily C (CFTR/MRP), member 1